MDQSVFNCWISCFNKVQCPRGLRRHRNRVAPLKKVPVIVTGSENQSEINNCNNTNTKNGNHVVKPTINGDTNLYFQGNQVRILNSDNPEPVISEDIPDSTNAIPQLSCNGDIPHNHENEKPVDFLDSAIYLQIGKDKTIRVLHIKPKNPYKDDSTQVEAINKILCNRSNSSCSNSLSCSSEDEEEYWFTRWDHQPKLKNIFTPKIEDLENFQSSPEVVVELNSQFKYEEIENANEILDETEDRLSLKNIFRKNSSDSTGIATSHPSIHNNNTNTQGGSTNESFENDGDNASLHSNHSKSNHTNCHAIDNSSPLPLLQPQSPTPNSPKSFTNLAFEYDDHDEESTEEGGKVTSLKTDKLDNKFNVPQCSDNNQNSPVLNSNTTSDNMNSNPKNKNRTGKEKVDNDNNQSPQSDSSNLKPIIFLIHGISGSCDIWKSQIQFFHKLNYEVVVPELLGHGLSSTPNKEKYYLFESLVQDLVIIFDHFIKEDRKCIIIGHGYGACIATVLSRIRFKSIILLISVSGGGPTPMFPPGCLERHLLPRKLNIFHRRKKCIGRYNNPDLAHVLPTKILQYLLEGQLWIDGDAGFYRRVTVPTLLIYGMRDRVVSLIEECEMERTIPRAFLELIPTAGHMVMWDEPKKFNKMLLRFIKSWS